MSAIIGLITARGGSRGIPGKNIKPLAGKPLIAWTVEAALASGVLDRVIVSTDDRTIADTAAAYGAEVPFMRPAALAGDHSSHIDVVRHALDWLAEAGTPCDYVLTLQPTSPFRSPDDIRQAVALVHKQQPPAVIGVRPAEDHPYMVQRLNEAGTLAAFVSTDLDYLRRQDFPPAYTINGAIYLTAVDVIREQGTLMPTGTLPYIMPPERSLDIDTPFDWHIADLLARTPFATGSGV